MRTLEFQRQHLENDIIESKAKIRLIKESDFPDINALNQLHDTITRNMQVIGMIDQHLQTTHSRVNNTSIQQ